MLCQVKNFAGQVRRCLEMSYSDLNQLNEKVKKIFLHFDTKSTIIKIFFNH